MTVSHETGKGLPQAISESVLTISGVPLRVYVLDDGQRIINADDVADLFAAWESGAPVVEAEARVFSEFMRRPPAQEGRDR